MNLHRRTLRLFLDSNVLTGGMVSRWGVDKAVLSLCAARVCKLVLAEAVREEVEANLLLHAASLPHADAEQLLADYQKLLALTAPEKVPYPPAKEVLAARGLIAHAADVPVLLSAQKADPDWLLTNNRKHFTGEVAKRAGLRIGSPADFFRCLAIRQPVA
ncbi:MAG: PIN domain-containing protein [Bryobacteraceae bacterium]